MRTGAAWIVVAGACGLAGCHGAGRSPAYAPTVETARQTMPLMDAADDEWARVNREIAEGRPMPAAYVAHVGELRYQIVKLYLENALSLAEPSDRERLERKRVELEREVAELPARRREAEAAR
jgi:hypothetical protein